MIWHVYHQIIIVRERNYVDLHAQHGGERGGVSRMVAAFGGSSLPLSTAGICSVLLYGPISTQRCLR
jgi:hypothetical protein